MPEEIQDIAKHFMDVPEENRHSLLLRVSGGMVLKEGVEGHEDYIPCIAIKALMTPWGKEADEKGEPHLFIIDLRQALKLKRTIERTIEHLGDKAKGLPEY